MARITGRLSELKLLYVEDDDDIRDQLAQFLKRRVGELITANDGRAGLEEFERAPPDLVISDILMPRMDGLEMIREIRARDPEVPVIITTAYNEESYFLRSIELGIDRYVLKPIDLKILRESLEKIAEAILLRREREEVARHMRFMLDTHPNFFLMVDCEGVTYLNLPFLRFLGFSGMAEFIASDTPLARVFLRDDGSPLDEESALALSARLVDRLREHPIIYMRSGDELLPFAVNCSQPPGSNRAIFSFAEIALIAARYREMEKLANSDPLTGCANRALFSQVLERELLRSVRVKSPLSLIIFDIDHFKRVNDTHGHPTGDAVLIGLTTLIAAQVRRSDLLARYGGEEFIIMLPDTAMAQAAGLAEKLRVLVAESIFPQVRSITCSFGVAQLRSLEESAQLIERADQALYQAKRNGRNRVERG